MADHTIRVSDALSIEVTPNYLYIWRDDAEDHIPPKYIGLGPVDARRLARALVAAALIAESENLEAALVGGTTTAEDVAGVVAGTNPLMFGHVGYTPSEPTPLTAQELADLKEAAALVGYNNGRNGINHPDGFADGLSDEICVTAGITRPLSQLQLDMIDDATLLIYRTEWNKGLLA